MSDVRPGIRRLFTLGLRRKDLAADEMDEEVRFHLDARIERLVRAGRSPDEARAEAIRRLGANSLDEAVRVLQLSAREKERTIAWRERTSEIAQDLRYAARGLVRRPGFTLVALATLAIGIGANTALFGAVNALLLRPLPFREPERLMQISLTPPATAQSPTPSDEPWSWPKFTYFRDRQQSFSDVALWSDERFTLADGDAERVYGERVSARYLSTLGVQPLVGHDFPTSEDAAGGAPPLVLLSHAVWSRRFKADPTVIGRTMHIDDTSFEIVGVTPPNFRGLSGRAEVFVPVTTRSAEDLAEAWSLEYSQVARLKPGVTIGRARAETRVLGSRVYASTPMKEAAGTGGYTWSADARSLNDTRVAPVLRRSLLLLFGAVGFVLLIACVNLASLLLGRAAARGSEIAIRVAIGAGRGRLVRLLLTESMLLGMLGGVASLGVAWVGTRALSAVNPQTALSVQGLSGLGVVNFASIRLDASALLFTFVVSLLVGVLFGLVPALQSTRVSLQAQLKGGAAAPSSGRASRHVTSRRVLVVSEIALAMVLLAGAVLTLRSLYGRLRVDPGFDASNVLTVQLSISPQQVPRDSMPGFYAQLLDRLQALPGVTQAALADCPPLNGGCNETIITFPGRPPVVRETAPGIGVHTTTRGWFQAMRIPLKRGRIYSDADRLGTEKVLVINEAAAHRFWPNEDPIGKQAAVMQGGFHTGATVIGIVGDVRFGTIDSLPQPDAFMSYEQSPRSSMMIFLRTSVDPNSLAAAVRAAVSALSPSYPVYDVRTMASRVAAATSQARLSAVLFSLFAVMALSLAVVGVYGVMSFAVAQRTREIGIRMALGANRSTVRRLVLGEGLAMTAAGAAVGIAAATVLSRLLQATLFDVSPSDPVTYVVILIVVTLAALLASWLPARRAATIAPAEALRGS